jgi:hypothetical protein
VRAKSIATATARKMAEKTMVKNHRQRRGLIAGERRQPAPRADPPPARAAQQQENAKTHH